MNKRGPIVDADGNLYFERMSPAQRNAMNHVAFSGYATSRIPTEKTLKSLVDAGLIVERKRAMRDGFGAYEITDYEMPIDIHMVWCCLMDDGKEVE